MQLKWLRFAVRCSLLSPGVFGADWRESTTVESA